MSRNEWGNGETYPVRRLWVTGHETEEEERGGRRREDRELVSGQGRTMMQQISIRVVSKWV